MILKIFTLQLLRNCYQNASTLLKQKYKLQKMIRKYTIEKRGDLFDVAMGAYDGTDVCKLVGTFLLKKLVKFVMGWFGLFRDDSLAIFRNKSGTQLEKAKKKLPRLFKE